MPYNSRSVRTPLIVTRILSGLMQGALRSVQRFAELASTLNQQVNRFRID